MVAPGLYGTDTKYGCLSDFTHKIEEFENVIEEKLCTLNTLKTRTSFNSNI